MRREIRIHIDGIELKQSIIRHAVWPCSDQYNTDLLGSPWGHHVTERGTIGGATILRTLKLPITNDMFTSGLRHLAGTNEATTCYRQV